MGEGEEKIISGNKPTKKIVSLKHQKDLSEQKSGKEKSLDGESRQRHRWVTEKRGERVLNAEKIRDAR